MNTNTSFTSATLLTMESLNVSPAGVYPAFLFGALAYVLILFCNVLILTAIAVDRRLHKPMFILLFNLPCTDLVGATALFPQLLLSIVTRSRSISYPACCLQGVMVHLYGTGNLLVLSAMAYDRYIAICCPLRYNSMMSQNKLIRIIIMIWLVDFSFIIVLFALLSRLRICRTKIVDIYCNNPSIMKLQCGDISVNNYYGLLITAIIQGGSMLTIVFTYLHIFLTCVINKQSDARVKAIQTCGTHLVVFLFLEINAAFALIAHRFENASPYMRRILGLSVMVFPPILNPIVYGLRTKELRQNIKTFFKRNLSSIKS